MVLMSLIAGHHDLDLDVLDQLSVGGHDVAREAVLSRTGPDGAVVLATCNRYEVYLEVADEAAVASSRETVTELVAQASGLDRAQVAAHLRVLTGPDVAAHLFEVAAGLDSMVVGEQEISGQVRRALTSAREVGTTSSGLEHLFQSASRSARAVATRTGLGAAGRSLVSVALDLARERLTEAGATSWALTRVVLVGTGSYAGASLAALRARGAHDVHVYSQSGRAVAFADARGIVAIEDSALPAAVAGADMVLACSGVAGPVLDADRLGAIRRSAGAAEGTGEGDGPRPLVVVDLALRHDVDPSVADLPGVHLITLDTVAKLAPDRHAQPVEEARVIVEAAVEEFMADQRGRERSAEVVAARDRALEAAEVEIARRLGGPGAVPDGHDAGPTAPERELRALRRAARAAVHGPTVRAHAAARIGDVRAYEEALDELHAFAAGVVSVLDADTPRGVAAR